MGLSSIKEFFKIYQLLFLDIWYGLFNEYKIKDSHEYIGYLSKRLHHRIILSSPIVILLILSKITIYFFSLNYSLWLGITLVSFILTDIALLAILFISIFTRIPDQKYYKNMLALASFSLISCVLVYIYFIKYNIDYPYEILGLAILLFLWVFNYPFIWIITIPFIAILLYSISTLFLIPYIGYDFIIDIFILSVSFLVGSFYSLMHGANEYNLFKSFKEAEQQSLTDALTKINNRKGFLKQFNNLHKIAKREGKKIYIAIIDIDNFKSINDNYGHDIGDQVIIGIANQLKKICRRPLDIIGRWGGEEFIMYWCEESNDQKTIMAEKITQTIRDMKLVQSNNLKVTASVGVTNIIDSDLFDEALRRADDALYKAKNNGKNQFIVG